MFLVSSVSNLRELPLLLQKINTIFSCFLDMMCKWQRFVYYSVGVGAIISTNCANPHLSNCIHLLSLLMY